MDIKQLRYFVGVADAKSYSIAAKMLYVSQPTLSKAMKHLEEELGVKLFAIVGKKVHITDCGKQLYSMASNVIEQHNAILCSMQNLTELKQGVIKVGIPPIIGTCVFPRLIAGFIEKYPGIDIIIDQHGASNIQQLVYDGKLDVGFTILPTINDAFNIVQIVEDKNVLVVSSQHPLANRSIVDYKELLNEKFVLLDEEYMLYNNIIAGCRENGFEPRLAVKASQWDFVVQLVKLGMGISILPKRILDMYPEHGICQVEINHHSSRWCVAMISKKGSYEPFAVKTFIDYICEYAMQTFE